MSLAASVWLKMRRQFAFRLGPGDEFKLVALDVPIELQKLIELLE